MGMSLFASTGGVMLSDGALKMLLVGMIIYMVGMLIIGWLSSRKVSEMSDFLVAGRRLVRLFLLCYVILC